MILLDTNILVHAAASKSPHHRRATEIRDQAASGEIEACVAAQVLNEFYAVVTDSRRFAPPLTPARARRELQSYLSSRIGVVLPKDTTLPLMLKLAVIRPVRRGRIFDLFLAATMLDNGVRTIYTENTRDFQGISGVDAINPFSH